MRDFNSQLIKSLKISGFLMALLCVALVMYPGDPVVWGLLIGIATGMVSAFFMANRANKAVEMDVDQGKIQIMIGSILRLIFIIIVLYFVFRTGWVSLLATAGGIFVVHGVFILLSVGSRGANGEAPVNDKTQN
ncbi:MAG: ATP synthase subunit I [Peptococcaceae bacterium]|nr:ATP synthase subunit I [Peptococcaceae bacterium]